MKKYLIPLLFAFAFAFVSCDDDEVLSHTVLSAPTSLTSVIDAGSHAVNFTWDAVNGAAYYVMYYNVQGSNSFEKSGNLTDTQFTFYSEDYGTTYEFKVRAENEDAVSDFSEICTVTIPANWEVTLDAPTNVTAEFNATMGVINVTWDAVSGADSYTVYYNVEGDLPYSSNALTVTEFTFSVDTYGVNYEIKVQATGGGVTSPYSETVVCNVPAEAVPTIPTPVLSNIREGLGWINVTIVAEDEGYDYQVYEGDTLREDWGAEYIKTNDDGSFEYSIYGLELNKSYSDIRIVAVSNDETSYPAMLGDVTMGNIWQKTMNPSATHLFFEWDDAAANANWTFDSSIDPLTRTFEIQLAKDANFTDIVYDIYTVNQANSGSYVNLNWVGRSTLGSSGTTAVMGNSNTTACLGFLDPSTTYYFRVKNMADHSITYNSTTTTLNAKNGTSAWSPAISATTEPEHVAVDGELLWQDFNDHGWFGDFANNCCGLVPLNSSTSASTYLNWDPADGYGLRQSAIGLRYDEMKCSVQTDFHGNTAPEGCNNIYTFEGGTELYPSLLGWYFSKATYPAAGAAYVGNSSTQINLIITPAFDMLTEATTVIFSCDVTSASAVPLPETLLVKAYRVDTDAYELVGSQLCQAAYESNPNGGEEVHLCGVFEHPEIEFVLNPGDSIVLEVDSTVNVNHQMLIDNISVVKK